MNKSPVITWDEDTNRFGLIYERQDHPLALNTYKTEGEALKAWKLWNQSTAPKKPKPLAPHIPTYHQSCKTGVCQQCLRPGAWHESYPSRQWHWSGRPNMIHAEVPRLTAYNMNLCPACYAVFKKSAEHWTPSPDFISAG